MQTHHKNGVKTDNREGNLECLCIKCHSEVDDTHRRNFSSAAQKVLIEDYMRKYHGKESDSLISRLMKAVRNRQESPTIIDDELPFEYTIKLSFLYFVKIIVINETYENYWWQLILYIFII